VLLAALVTVIRSVWLTCGSAQQAKMLNLVVTTAMTMHARNNPKSLSVPGGGADGHGKGPAA
jgi:hypothetical protein